MYVHLTERPVVIVSRHPAAIAFIQLAEMRAAGARLVRYTVRMA